MEEKQHKYKKRLPFLVLLILLVILLYVLVAGKYLTFEQLKSYKDGLYHFVRQHYFMSAAGLIVIYVVMAGLSMPGGPVVTMAGGFVFGILQAAIFVNIGATMGATIAFLLSRYLVGDWVQTRFKDQLKTFNHQFEQNGIYFLLTLRFAPIFPFTWLNLFCGLTNISIVTFLWTTALGILPGTLLAAYTGSQLGQINSPEDLLSPGIWIAFILLSIFAFLPVVYKKLKR
jgi:uncharacterized membrane protein YdjX (TVP38/TMEM64 family)